MPGKSKGSYGTTVLSIDIIMWIMDPKLFKEESEDMKEVMDNGKAVVTGLKVLLRWKNY